MGRCPLKERNFDARYEVFVFLTATGVSMKDIPLHYEHERLDSFASEVLA